MGEVAKAVFFTDVGDVEARDVEVGEPEPDEVVVDASVSAVSVGTERLVYSGRAPEVDAEVNGADELTYPTKYGYSVVGEVVEAGDDVGRVGERVHVLHPHQSLLTVPSDEARRVPDGLTDTDAAFLPAAETAVGFVMDGSPVVGERVAVFGQGVVGLLTTAVLSEFPVDVTTFEPCDDRRRISCRMGADASHPPDEARDIAPDTGYDLVYEVSGSPPALDTAVGVVGYDGRVVVGSWYGKETAELSLGTEFHRKHASIVDSQVSTIAPEHRGRWTKQRRLDVAWDFVRRVEPSRFVKATYTPDDAEEAYNDVEDGALCVAFNYG